MQSVNTGAIGVRRYRSCLYLERREGMLFFQSSISLHVRYRPMELSVAVVKPNSYILLVL